jgi:hypothetical protein
MGFLSELFKKQKEPEPYDWAYLKQVCVEAMDAHMVVFGMKTSPLDQLDYDRLCASGDAQEVVLEIFAVIKNAKWPALSNSQTREYLCRAADILRPDIGPQEALACLLEVEASLRKK